MDDFKKPRLFVDMDGTLAEWRNITLHIEKEEDRLEVLDKLNKILLTPNYFYSLKPQSNVIEAIKLLSEKFDIYIITCVMEKEGTPNPAMEKHMWLDKYLPFLDKSKRIFVPNGEDKSLYLPGGMKPGDHLLDDYTKNLLEFEKAGGTGIKLLNNVNGQKGRWMGSKVDFSSTPDYIAKTITFIIEENVIVRHTSPEKEEPLFELKKDTDISDLELEFH